MHENSVKIDPFSGVTKLAKTGFEVCHDPITAMLASQV